jgi:branched-chain amino acid transport system ATP-binding protein
MTTTATRIGDIVLELEGISLSFGGVKALNDISLDVREHEIRAIIGPNGAGKSSLLNVINGVYHPQQGTITFRGKPRRDMDTHETAALGIARTSCSRTSKEISVSAVTPPNASEM